MAAGVTRISDVVVPAIFSPYVQQLTTVKSALVQSGAVVVDASLSAKLDGGGLTFNQPSFKDIDDDVDNVSSDDPAVFAVPNKIGTSSEIQVRLSRNNSWSSMDLTAALAGADPMEAISNRVADYWQRRLQTAFIATMAGIFAENATALPANATQNDMTFNVSGGAFVANVTQFSAEAFFDASQTMGDAADGLGMAMAHSIVRNRMNKLNLIDFVPDSEGKVVENYMGKPLIVDDRMPNTGGIFETWIFGGGAVKLGQGSPEVPTEVGRVPLAGNGGGQDILINRTEWIIHPEGHAYVGTAPAGGPTNASTVNQLAHMDSWQRAWTQRKQVRIARLITREF